MNTTRDQKFIDLPLEILILIFSQLDKPKDIISASLVCKLFHKATRDDHIGKKLIQDYYQVKDVPADILSNPHAFLSGLESYYVMMRDVVENIKQFQWKINISANTYFIKKKAYHPMNINRYHNFYNAITGYTPYAYKHDNRLYEVRINKAQKDILEKTNYQKGFHDGHFYILAPWYSMELPVYAHVNFSKKFESEKDFEYRLVHKPCDHAIPLNHNIDYNLVIEKIQLEIDRLTNSKTACHGKEKATMIAKALQQAERHFEAMGWPSDINIFLNYSTNDWLGKPQMSLKSALKYNFDTELMLLSISGIFNVFKNTENFMQNQLTLHSSQTLIEELTDSQSMSVITPKVKNH